MNEIVNTDYANWLQSISKRYRQSQIKAAVAVNAEMLKFYFGLGADIVRMEKDQPWGSGFLKRLSLDLKMQKPEAECFSPRNLQYMRLFFKLYSPAVFAQQVVAQSIGIPHSGNPAQGNRKRPSQHRGDRIRNRKERLVTHCRMVRAEAKVSSFVEDALHESHFEPKRI